MKVSEARYKLCPFMSIGFAADHPDFRNGGLVEITCKCGDCMAWEWTFTADYKLNRADNRVKVDPGDHEGYCKRLNNE